MTIKIAHLPDASFFALWLIGFISIGPFISALDQVFDFLPMQYRGFQHLHHAGRLAQALWIGPGALGVASMTLILHRQALAFVATLIFALTYISGVAIMWHQFSFLCVAAIVAVVLTGVGMWAPSKGN